jgi:hypothetical protein
MPDFHRDLGLAADAERFVERRVDGVAFARMCEA